jgi:hypothetical protein
MWRLRACPRAWWPGTRAVACLTRSSGPRIFAARRVRSRGALDAGVWRLTGPVYALYAADAARWSGVVSHPPEKRSTPTALVRGGSCRRGRGTVGAMAIDGSERAADVRLRLNGGARPGRNGDVEMVRRGPAGARRHDRLRPGAVASCDRPDRRPSNRSQSSSAARTADPRRT